MRALLTERLCSPTAPLPARDVYNELVNRSHVVEEFHFSKSTRRAARQRVALEFLRRYNVLLHGLLFYVRDTHTWNTTAEFHRLAMVGEAVLATEVRTRLLRLFPDMPYSTFSQSLPTIVGEEGLAAAFDRLQLQRIVGSKPTDERGGVLLSRAQKSHMLCAVIAEMYWFVARTRPTDLTHNNAMFPPSDVLILHVLCTHLVECIPAELIYSVVEPIVEEMKQVWINEPMSLPSQLRLTPRTICALSLNTVPLPRAEAGPSSQERCQEAHSRQRALSASPDRRFVKSLMRPSLSARHAARPRFQILETDPALQRLPLAAERGVAAASVKCHPSDDAQYVARAMELARLAVRGEC